jgi:hypothetical protein
MVGKTSPAHPSNAQALVFLMPADGLQFVILKRLGTVPVMGGCAVCGRKFFTPPQLLKDAVGAGNYLRRKFDRHECSSRS